MPTRPARTSNGPGLREVLALAVPALGSLAAEPLMGLLDTALIGRIGTRELAALGAANALFGLLATSLIFLEYGTTARLARLYGAGKLDRLVEEGMQMAWLAILLGLGITVVLRTYPERVLSLLQIPAEVVAPATTYLTIRAFGTVPVLLFRVANGVFRGLQDTKTPLYVVVAMNAINAVLDIVLIFGWEALGIPAYGIAGAAWATTIASVVGPLVLFALLPGRLRRLGAHGRISFRLRGDLLLDLAGLSRDLFLRTLGLQAALFTGTRMAASVGTAALAAHQVGWQLWYFLALLLDSLAIAGQALVGRLLGEGDVEAARRLGFRLSWAGIGLGTFFCLAFLVLRDPLPRIFTAETDVLAQVDSIFLLLALMQIPNGWLFVLDGLLIGASDMKFLRNSMVLLGIFGVACAWLGYALTGTLRGVWLGITVFMIARMVVMDARWRSGRWAYAEKGAADQGGA